MTWPYWPWRPNFTTDLRHWEICELKVFTRFSFSSFVHRIKHNGTMIRKVHWGILQQLPANKLPGGGGDNTYWDRQFALQSPESLRQRQSVFRRRLNTHLFAISLLMHWTALHQFLFCICWLYSVIMPPPPYIGNVVHWFYWLYFSYCCIFWFLYLFYSMFLRFYSLSAVYFIPVL